MKLSLIAGLFWPIVSFADPGPQAIVWSRNPSAVRKFFPADKYRMMDAASEQKELEASGYLTPHRRAALFHKLDLEKSLQGLDEMDKDMLVMGARFEKLPALMKHYPMLTEWQLRGLQREIHEMAKK